MQKVLYKAGDRGAGEYGWLSTRYSFSFANWYDPERMGFGKLRVLNDDTIAPASGFPMHSHRDMEIITIVTEGTLTHQDNLGNKGEVRAGDVQVMSAGTGVTHSEYNASASDPLSLFQIWIEPEQSGGDARYAQASFHAPRSRAGFVHLVGPLGTPKVLTIQQQAHIFRGFLRRDETHAYRVRHKGNGVFIFVIQGELETSSETLSMRDAIGISGETEILLSTPSSADVLIIETPL